MSWSNVSSCLDRLTISAKAVRKTLAHVEHGVVDLYSFEGIASDSTQVVHSLAGGCNLPVHEVKVHLREELATIKRDALGQLGLDAIEDLDAATENTTLPARAFHERLATVFRRLNDAHTLYLPPWAQSLPLFVYTPRLSATSAADGLNAFAEDEARSLFVQLRLRLGEGSNASEADPAVVVEMRVATGLGSEGVQATTPWMEVETLNDQPAFEYLLAEADSAVGNYKSLGARLNALLNYWGDGRFPLTLPLPRKGTLGYLLKVDNASTAEIPEHLQPAGTLDVVVLADSTHLQSLEDFQDHIHSNPNCDIIEDFFDTQMTLSNRTRTGGNLTKLWSISLPALGGPRWDSWPERPSQSESLPQAASRKPAGEARAKVGAAAEPRRLQDAIEEIDHVPHFLVDPVYVAYKLTNAVVLKVTSFMPPPLFPSPINFFASLMDLIKIYKKTVDVAVAQNTDRLILDLTDNGGGIVELANLLTLLVAPRHHTDTKLCAHYGIQMHKFWGKWLQSFGGGFDEVMSMLDGESEADLEERFRRLLHLDFLKDATNGEPSPVDAQAVDEALEKVSQATSTEEKRRLLREALEGRGWLDESSLLGENTSAGWYPLTGDLEDPVTGEPFDPPTAPYTDQEVHEWGVTGTKNYTKRYMFACSAAWNPFVSLIMWFLGASITKAKHQWKEIAVLTNGLCGSACSLVASQLQFKEGAAVFTYGGVPGQLMDSSAFAGGNVEDYRHFWPNVLYAALVGDILYGPDTPIGSMLREEGARERGYSGTLLLPLPTQALARFNYNMMFQPELGPEALPREWYVVAAHHHFLEWHATSASSPDTWSRLFGIYGKVAGMDWAAVREDASGRLNTSGISYGCAADPPTAPFVRETDWDIYI